MILGLDADLGVFLYLMGVFFLGFCFFLDLPAGVVYG